MLLINNSPVASNLTALFRIVFFGGENGIVDDEVVVSDKECRRRFNVNFDYNYGKYKHFCQYYNRYQPPLTNRHNLTVSIHLKIIMISG